VCKLLAQAFHFTVVGRGRSARSHGGQRWRLIQR
jgi:hypothetical protein